MKTKQSTNSDALNFRFEDYAFRLGRRVLKKNKSGSPDEYVISNYAPDEHIELTSLKGKKNILVNRKVLLAQKDYSFLPADATAEQILHSSNTIN